MILAEAIEGNQALDQAPQISEETAKLAELGRNGDGAPSVDPNVKPAAPSAIPEGFPSQFVKDGKPDYDALAKSYTELRTKMDSGKAAEPEPSGEEASKPATDSPKIGDQKKAGEEAPKEESPTAAPEIGTLFQSAAAAYAENNGELPDESRKAIIEAGVPEAVLDSYLAGVKAQEKALATAVFEVAGGEEGYRSAVAWAAENWDPEQIEAFDAAIGNPKLMKQHVRVLMADFKEATGSAPPEEGKRIEPSAGIQGDVYGSKEEFIADLAKAQGNPNLTEQQVARKAAIAKLERSKRAGTVKEVTPRSGLFRN